MVTVKLSKQQIEFLLNVLGDGGSPDFLCDVYKQALRNDEIEDYLGENNEFYGIPLTDPHNRDSSYDEIATCIEEVVKIFGDAKDRLS